ncbi:MAG: CHAT domain-containing protein [Cyanobacteria bacterium P01_F01_bin.150]
MTMPLSPTLILLAPLTLGATVAAEPVVHNAMSLTQAGFRSQGSWRTLGSGSPDHGVTTAPEPFSVEFSSGSTPQLIAQITPDGTTSTGVNATGGIRGGEQAGDNIFHSFSEFNLGSGDIANFLVDPAIQNILSRITGGNASLINGEIRVSDLAGNTSTANLVLMNPAGIIFGDGASLNVAGDFMATTATGIGFGDNWFNAIGDNDFSLLLGNPDGLAFSDSQVGSIVNTGNLAVANGQTLSLIGGTVASPGNLAAPEGQIFIVSVAGGSRLRFSQGGSVLNFEIETGAEGLTNELGFTPLSLPDLLTGGTFAEASTVIVTDGAVQLTDGTPVNDGDVVAGNISTASTPGVGGAVAVQSQGVAIASSINTSSASRSATGGAVGITAADAITLGDVTTAASATFETATAGSVVLESPSTITVGDIDASATASVATNGGSAIGGAVTVNAGDAIATNTITTTATASAPSTAAFDVTATGGAVQLETPDNIQFESIDSSAAASASGSATGTGGNVSALSNNLVQGTGTNADGTTINTQGTSAGGTVTIQHDGDRTNESFTIGDASTNGTAGAIAAGTIGNPVTASVGESFENSGIETRGSNGEIAINFINTAPTLTSGGGDLGEVERDESLTFSVDDLLLTLDDTDGDITTVEIETINGGTLTRDGVVLSPGDAISAGETLVFTPDGSGEGSVEAFTVVGSDRISTSSSATFTATLLESNGGNDGDGDNGNGGDGGSGGNGGDGNGSNGGNGNGSNGGDGNGSNGGDGNDGNGGDGGNGGAGSNSDQLQLPDVLVLNELIVRDRAPVSTTSPIPTAFTQTSAVSPSGISLPISAELVDLAILPGVFPDAYILATELDAPQPTSGGASGSGANTIASNNNNEPHTAQQDDSVFLAVFWPGFGEINPQDPDTQPGIDPKEPNGNPTELEEDTNPFDSDPESALEPEGEGSVDDVNEADSSQFGFADEPANSDAANGDTANSPAANSNISGPGPDSTESGEGRRPGESSRNRNPDEPATSSESNPTEGSTPNESDENKEEQRTASSNQNDALPSGTSQSCEQQARGIQRGINNGVINGQTNTDVSSHTASPQYQQLTQCYQQQLQTARANQNIKAESQALHNLGVAAYVTGDYRVSLDLHNQQLSQAQSTLNLFSEALALAGLGRAQAGLGNYRQAIAHFDQALSLIKPQANPQWEALIQRNLGKAHQVQRNYEQALDHLQQSLVLSRSIGDRTGEMQSLGNLGTLSMVLGQFNQAQEQQQQSLELARELGDRLQEVHSLLGLGTTHAYQQDFTTALDYHQQSLLVIRYLGARLGEGIALTNIGDSLFHLNRFSDAETALFDAVTLWEQLRAGVGNNDAFKISIFETQQTAYRNLQETLIAQNNTSTALEVSERGRARAFVELVARQTGGSSELASSGVGELGSWGVGEFGSSGVRELDFDLSTTRLSARRTSQSNGGSGGPGGSGAEGSGINSEIGGAIAHPQIAQLQRIAKEQNATLVEYSIIREKQIQSPHGASVQYTADPQDSKLFIWVIQPNGIVDFRQVDLTQQEQSLEELITNNRIASNIRGEGHSATPQHHSVPTSQLPNSLTLDQLAVGDRVRRLGEPLNRSPYVVEAINPDNTITLTNPDFFVVAPVPIEELYKAETESQTERGSWSQWRPLHQLLIDPIADLLPENPSDRLIIIPQEQLFMVPFAALQDDQGRYLIERHTLVTAPSIQLLEFTHQRRQQLVGSAATGSKRSSSPALIVGNPSPMPENLRSLPAATTEATTIGQLLNTTPLVGPTATETQVRQQLTTAPIIHLATHGRFDEEKPLSGAIALAPSASDDGLLTAAEILQLNQRLNAELVILSACDTGRGRITGDGVIGLARSFLAAGTPSVVVSLWQVPDQATADLMINFHRYRQQHGDTAQALRQAILDQIEQTPDPINWAAFTLVGES